MPRLVSSGRAAQEECLLEGCNDFDCAVLWVVLESVSIRWRMEEVNHNLPLTCLILMCHASKPEDPT